MMGIEQGAGEIRGSDQFRYTSLQKVFVTTRQGASGQAPPKIWVKACPCSAGRQACGTQADSLRYVTCKPIRTGSYAKAFMSSLQKLIAENAESAEIFFLLCVLCGLCDKEPFLQWSHLLIFYTFAVFEVAIKRLLR